MKLRDILDKTKSKVVGLFIEWSGNRKSVVAAVVFAVMLIFYIVLGAVSNNMISRLPDQLGAKRWSDEMTRAQVSIFVTQDQMVSENSLRQFNYTFEQKLADAGVKDPDEDEDSDKKPGSGIVDTIGIDDMNSEEPEYTVPEKTGISKLIAMAYSAQGTATVSYDNRVLDTASIIGVSGDFFLFHPMTLVSGSYFGADDLMKDHIVVDEDVAWQLFGSTDIVGQCVTVGGVPHYISGVVMKNKGTIEKAAGLSNCYIYMSLDSLSRYGDAILSGRNERTDVSEDGTSEMSGGINCIEIVCPNPVRGLAARIAKESIGLDENAVVVIDNTDRFSVFSLFNVLRSFGTRSMWGKAIFYPYWENLARGYEDILATILFFRLIALLTMVIIFTVAVVNSYRNKKWTVRGVIKYLSDKKYDLEVSHNQKKLEKNVVNAVETTDGGEE